METLRRPFSSVALESHKLSVLFSLVHAMMLRGHQSYSYLTPGYDYSFLCFWELKHWWLHLFVLILFFFFNLLLDCKFPFKQQKSPLQSNAVPAQPLSFSGTGNELENLNNSREKLWIISFLSLLHASLFWVMLWKHIVHSSGNVKMINNILGNHQIISKVNRMLELQAKTFT